MQTWMKRRFEMTRTVELGMHVRKLEPAGPSGAILYVHGLGESGLCFERWMADPRLADWSHLAVDLIGYGKSTWNDEPWSLAEHAAHLDRYLERSYPEPVVVVGHSMGGVIGQLLCESYPARVRAFLNVEGNISSADCNFSGPVAALSLEAWLDRGYGELLERLFGDRDERPDVIRPYCASVQMCDPRAFHRNSGELVAVSGEETLAARLGGLAIPTLYVHGSPRGTGERSLGQLQRAGAETLAIADAGHWSFLDHPEQLVEVLAGFLEGVAAASR